MSVLIRFSPPSATTEQYDETIKRLEEEGNFSPDGLEYHIAYLSDSGLRVSEVWSTKDQLDAFGERLMPVLTDVGIDPGEPELLEVHNVVQP